MLEFWFSQNTPIKQKILVILIALSVAIILYVLYPMPSQVVLLFIASGMVFLICRVCQIYFTEGHPSHTLYRIFMWIPLAVLCTIIFSKAMDHLLEWGIQGIAMMIVTICLLSIHVLFKKQSK